MSEKKNQYHHGSLKEAIISHSLEIIAREGLKSLSLREVSRRAGVSNAAFYRHFPDKDSVLREIARRGFESLMDYFSRYVNIQGMGPEAALREACKRYILFAQEHPAYLRVMFGGILAQEGTPESLIALSQASFAQLRSIVEQGQAIGKFKAGNASDFATVSWSAMHGAAMLRIDNNILPDDESLAELLATTLVEGLGQPQ